MPRHPESGNDIPGDEWELVHARTSLAEARQAIRKAMKHYESACYSQGIPEGIQHRIGEIVAFEKRIDQLLLDMLAWRE
jgi:hypothetical protein